MKTTILLIISFCVLNLSGQSIEELKAYPDSLYQSIEKNFSWKEYEVKVVHYRIKNHDEITAHLPACSYWITLSKNGKIIDRISEKHCESVGGCSGVYASENFRKPPFIFSKFGDYVGRIIVFNGDDSLVQFSGGVYFLSEDNNLLFTQVQSDISGFSVYDLEKRQIVMEFPELDFIVTSVIQRGDKFYGIAYPIEGELTDEKVVVIDLENRKIELHYFDKNLLLFGKPLEAKNDLKLARDCQCGGIERTATNSR